MKQRFILFRRRGIYYREDTVTRKQESLRTKDRAEALTLLHARNEAARQPFLNLRIAQTYLSATDPTISQRTWQNVMDEYVEAKTGKTVNAPSALRKNMRLISSGEFRFWKPKRSGRIQFFRAGSS